MLLGEPEAGGLGPHREIPNRQQLATPGLIRGFLHYRGGWTGWSLCYLQSVWKQNCKINSWAARNVMGLTLETSVSWLFRVKKELYHHLVHCLKVFTFSHLESWKDFLIEFWYPLPYRPGIQLRKTGQHTRPWPHTQQFPVYWFLLDSHQHHECLTPGSISPNPTRFQTQLPMHASN